MPIDFMPKFYQIVAKKIIFSTRDVYFARISPFAFGLCAIRNVDAPRGPFTLCPILFCVPFPGLCFRTS